MSVIPKNFDRMIPNLLDVFYLKALRRINKKQGPIESIHLSMSPATGYTGTVLAEAE
jgi:hypothetical protein